MPNSFPSPHKVADEVSRREIVIFDEKEKRADEEKSIEE